MVPIIPASNEILSSLDEQEGERASRLLGGTVFPNFLSPKVWCQPSEMHISQHKLICQRTFLSWYFIAFRSLISGTSAGTKETIIPATTRMSMAMMKDSTNGVMVTKAITITARVLQIVAEAMDPAGKVLCPWRVSGGKSILSRRSTNNGTSTTSGEIISRPHGRCHEVSS